MGEGELWTGPNFSAEGYEVEIERARFVENCFWATTKLLFEPLEQGEQRFRCFA